MTGSQVVGTIRRKAPVVALVALTGLYPLYSLAAILGTWILCLLLLSRTFAMGALSLSLPFDQVLTVNVAGFTVRFAHVAALALGLGAYATFLKNRSIEGNLLDLMRKPYFTPLVCFIAILCTAVALTFNLKKSVGYLGWAMFDIAFLALGMLVWIDGTRRAYWVTRAFLGIQVAVALYGLAQVAVFLISGFRLPFLVPSVGNWPRLNAFHYEPQYYAFFSIQAVSLLMYWWSRSYSPRKGSRLTFPLLLLSIATFLSLSRSGWLALLVLAVFGFVRATPMRRRLLLAGILLGCAGTVALSSVRFKETLVRMASAAFDPTEQTSSAPRLESLKYGLQIVRQNPFLGVGIGNYGAYLYEEIFVREPSEESKSEQWHSATPANMWVELLAETGLLGAGCFLIFLLLLFREMGRQARETLDKDLAMLLRGYRLALLMTFGVMYQFAQTLYRLDTWFLIGLCLSLCGIAARAQTKTEIARKAA